MIKLENTNKLTVKSKPVVIIKKDIEIVGAGILPGKTEYDFSNIPKEKHQIFLQAINSQL
jgi:hypothetical protein